MLDCEEKYEKKYGKFVSSIYKSTKVKYALSGKYDLGINSKVLLENLL